MMFFSSQFLRRAIRVLGLRYQSSVSYEEVRIPVPWGHIAGKFWGPQDKKPILTMHGWQDNCNSFDYLIPLLPKHLSYLCIDTPGHGYSSKLPEGMYYHVIDTVLTIKRVQEYFKWKTLSLMGHSLGAITSYSYGFLHPDNVDFAVCIDGLQPLMKPRRIEGVQNTLNGFLKYDKQNSDKAEPPSYTIQDMVKRLHESSRQSIALDKCEHLLKRNMRPSEKHPGKYYFGRDARLKCGPLLNWDPQDLYEASERVSFPLLLTTAEKTPFFSNAEYYKITFDNLRKGNKDFEMHRVKGTHHEHFNAPEAIAELITQFIMKHDKVDRNVTYNINEIKA